MSTATQKFNNVTVRIPFGADTKPLQAFVEAMGWTMTAQMARSEKVLKDDGSHLPSKRLRGVFKMESGFDYKKALYDTLKEKYEL